MEYNEILRRAREKHGSKYEYPKFEESRATDKIDIICPIHGTFKQVVYAHLRGQGCPKCVGERRGYTTADFIHDAKEKFGDAFDYSKTEYVNRRTKVCIISKELVSPDNPNGEFWQLPLVHLKSTNGMPFTGQRGRKYRKLTDEDTIKKKTAEFINKAKKIHGDSIDFSKTIYTGAKQKAIFICPKHGEFTALASSILQKHGCPKCAHRTAMTKDEFVEKARFVHGDKYDYSKTEIGKADDKVCIICPTHGEFYANIHKHLSGVNCPKCTKNKKMTTAEFIDAARKVHGGKYDYSKVEYVNSSTKVCITCPVHGEYWQTPHSHLSGQGCKFCCDSHAEQAIANILTKNGIVFEREYKFKNIKDKLSLPYDFFLPKHNMLIECQGMQHFDTKNNFWTPQVAKHDVIKHDAAEQNGIKLFYFAENRLKKKIDKLIKNTIYTDQNLFFSPEVLIKKIRGEI